MKISAVVPSISRYLSSSSVAVSSSNTKTENSIDGIILHCSFPNSCCNSTQSTSAFNIYNNNNNKFGTLLWFSSINQITQ